MADNFLAGAAFGAAFLGAAFGAAFLAGAFFAAAFGAAFLAGAFLAGAFFAGALVFLVAIGRVPVVEVVVKNEFILTCTVNRPSQLTIPNVFKNANIHTKIDSSGTTAAETIYIVSFWHRQQKTLLK